MSMNKRRRKCHRVGVLSSEWHKKLFSIDFHFSHLIETAEARPRFKQVRFRKWAKLQMGICDCLMQMDSRERCVVWCVCVKEKYNVKKHFDSLKITSWKWSKTSEDEESKWQFLGQFSMAIVSQICLSAVTVSLRQMWSIGVWIRARIEPDPGTQQGRTYPSQFPAQSTGAGWDPGSTPLELTPVRSALPGER